MSELAYENCYGVINNHIIGKSTVDNRNLALVYDPDSVYNKGDHCIHGMKYWVCEADNTTGAWDATKWTQTRVGEEISDLHAELIWTNPNMSATTFAAQNIDIDLSKYDAIEVFCKSANSSSRIKVGTIGYLNTSYGSANASYGVILLYRGVTVSASRISIANCYNVKTGVAESTDNTGCIPWYIYGIKF